MKIEHKVICIGKKKFKELLAEYYAYLDYLIEQAVKVFATKMKERIHGYEEISWDTDNCLCNDIDEIVNEMLKED